MSKNKRNKIAPSASLEWNNEVHEPNVCLICNNPTPPVAKKDSRSWVTLVETLCRLYSISSSNSPLINPFCSVCFPKINRVNQLIIQVEALQKEIQEYHNEFGHAILESFGKTPTSNPQYSTKFQIYEKYVTEQANNSEGNLVNAIMPNWTSNADSQIIHVVDSPDFFDPMVVSANEEIVESDEPIITVQESARKTKSPAGRNRGRRTSEFEYMVLKDGTNHNQCHFCLKVFKRRAALVRHLQVHQETAEPVAEMNPDDIFLDENSGLIKNKRKRKRSSKVSFNDSQQEVLRNQDTICQYCSKIFSHPTNLAKHLLCHTGERPYACQHCGKQFRDSSNRKRHEITTHSSNYDLKEVACELCGSKFRSKYSYYEHKKCVHLGYKRSGRQQIQSPCTICNKIFNTPRNLAIHVRLIHKKMYVTKYCPICEKPEKDRRSLLRHQETHKSLWELEKEGRSFFYKCTLCESSHPSKAKLKFHYELEHPNAPMISEKKLETKPSALPLQYKCPDCPEHPGYSRKESLAAHLKAGHRYRSSKTKFPCQICSKPMKDRARAKAHESTHDPTKNLSYPYSCSFCPPVFGLFTKKEDILKHFRMKHPEKPLPEYKVKVAKKYLSKFHCDDCPNHSGFTTRKGLKLHIEGGHGGRKPGPKSRKQLHHSEEEDCDKSLSELSCVVKLERCDSY